jgi:hypothetical protein
MIRLLLILLIAVSASAQEIPGIILDTSFVNNFSLGLHTSVSPIFVPSGAGTRVHNIDLSEGVLEVRKGYDSVSFIPGMDKIVGIYGAYYSWGEQQLIAATDSTGVGYGGLYASTMGTHDFGVLTDTFWVTADTASINADECLGAKPPASCFSLSPFADTIIFGDSTWVLSISPLNDSISSITWWADTLMAWINDVAGSYLTATKIGDTTVKIVEDTSSLDIIYRFKFDFVTQGQIVSTSAEQIWPYWSTQTPPSFAMFNDNLYVVNGDQRGVVWNGEVAQAYPLPAFGEPLITPIALQSGENTAYAIDGEVRYALAASVDSLDVAEYSDSLFGVISAPVNVKNGRFLLRNFANVAHDSLAVVGISDTLIYHIYRTLSNPGRLTQTTDMYNTGIKVKVHNPRDNGQVWIYDSRTGDTTTYTTFDSAIVIDSMPDSVLTDIGQTRKALSSVFAGRDSTGTIERRPGAPGFWSGVTITLDSTYKVGGSGDTLNALSIGIPEQKDTLGWAYAVAPVDTITGNEGPLSEFCVVFNDADATTYRRLIINLPALAPNDDGIVYNVYRAMIYQVGLFTPAYFIDTFLTGEGFGGLRPDRIETIRHTDGRITPRLWWDEKYQVDTTIIWIPFLVDQISGADSLISDSIRYDSLVLRKPYQQTTPPSRINKLFAYDGYMFGTDGSILYRSQVDSATKWGFWDFTPVNTNDGDRITTVWPTRTAIRVKKNFTSWNAYSDYQKREINQGRGCIASFSHILGRSHYFLSTRGIETESDGLTLERTVVSGLLSHQLSSFRDRTIADLSNMVAAYVPTEQLALFSLGDTTWAYFEEAGRRTQGRGGWATWSMTFKGATLYDTEEELNFIPGKTLYFFRDNDPNIYRYGTATTDNGVRITMDWRSGAFGVDRWKDRVEDIGLWVNSSDNTDSVLTAFTFNQDGTKNDSVIFPRLSNATYLLEAFGGFTPTQWFQIGLSNSGTISNTKINMIDFSVNPRAQDTPRQ